MTDSGLAQGSTEASPEYLEDRRVCEDFARRLVQATEVGEHCAPAVFLPWCTSGGTSPAGVVSPASRQGVLDLQQLEQAVRGKTVIIIGCTYQFQEERIAASNFVKQLLKVQQGWETKRCILIAHLLTPGGNQYSRQNYSKLMEVHEDINRLGADDVLLDPERDQSKLRTRILMAKQSWLLNQERLQAMLAEEPQTPGEKEVEALEAAHQQLLWEDIPRELMPKLKRAQSADFVETENRVGDYSLLEKMETQVGLVWEGIDSRSNRKVAVKITNKADISTPGQVEGIYREYRFLSGFTSHPNIVRVVDCFVCTKRIYTIMEFAGKQNIAQYLSDLPGNRMNETDALGCFCQLASAVAYSHGKDVSHRNISLEHVVVKPSEADGPPCATLVDFRDAMVAKEGVVSAALCGYLPCMAPEILSGWSGRYYLPKLADRWSLGVLLLEMAGGKGSFFKSVQVDESIARQHYQGTSPQASNMLADRILDHFQQDPANHGRALSCMSGLQSPEILRIIEGLLQPQENRVTLDEFVISEEAPHDDNEHQDAPAEP